MLGRPESVIASRPGCLERSYFGRWTFGADVLSIRQTRVEGARNCHGVLARAVAPPPRSTVVPLFDQIPS